MDNRNMRGENAFLLITEALLKHHNSGRLLVTSPEATFNQFAITADECCYLDFHHYNNSDPISLRREIQDSLHKEIEELQTLEGNFDTMICFNAWLALHENKQIGKSYLNAALRALDDGGRLIIPATHNFMRFPYWEETRNFILDNYHLTKIMSFSEYLRSQRHLHISNTTSKKNSMSVMMMIVMLKKYQKEQHQSQTHI